MREKYESSHNSISAILFFFSWEIPSGSQFICDLDADFYVYMICLPSQSLYT